MNKNEILEFVKAFHDFMEHCEYEISEYEKREELKNYAKNTLEKYASELEVTVDYYLQEFI